MLKNFVDRLIPLKCPYIIEKQGHFDLKDGNFKVQKFVILANCGFPGEKNFEILKSTVSCCNPSLEIYRNCGKLLKSKSPVITEKVNKWLKVVEYAGKEMVLYGKVSQETENDLNMQLMSVEEYISFLGMS